MDTNNTRFHLLMGTRDWRPLVDQESHLAWDADRSSLALERRLFQFRPTRPGAGPDLLARRGAARDEFGLWYWIAAPGTEIRTLPRDRSAAEHYWSSPDLLEESERAAPPESGGFGPKSPAPPPPLLELRGLTVTTHRYLAVGVVAPAGLLVFDLHAGGPPLSLVWPAGTAFRPFDIAPAPDGGIWILSADPDGPVPARLWTLDGDFRPVFTAGQGEIPLEPPPPAEFRPLAGAPAAREQRLFPTGIPLVGPERPIAIEALPDGTLLILDAAPGSPSSRLWRCRCGEMLGEPFATVVPASWLEPEEQAGGDLRLRGFDLAFVPAPDPDPEPDRVRGTVYVVQADGNQAFAISLTGDAAATTWELQRGYLPMQSFSGKGLVSAGPDAWYDYGDRWFPLTEQPRPRFATEGIITTPVFDGRSPDCVWHRLFLDACIPGGAAVRVESLAGDDAAALGDGWQEEPGLYRRTGGAELPYYQPFTADELAADGAGTWELLLQRARGRYLQLRLTLSGTGRNTPRIRALRAYYPRFSYLQAYLPDVYQADQRSAAFLERFLANPEGLFTALEGRIAQAQMLLDVRSVPAEYLDWLAGWFGVLLDPAWDERRRRLFIAHAPELFSQRGTVPGLVRTILLAIDPCPDDSLFTADVAADPRSSIRILESFRTRYRHPVQPDPLADVYDFRDFLAHRYRRIQALNDAYGLADRPYKAFTEIPLPATAPTGGLQQADWQAFVADYLPVVRQSHRFVVLVRSSLLGGGARRRLSAVVARVVRLAKPGHTEFAVREQGAVFAVGEAQLGYESRLDRGGRFGPIELGRDRAGRGYLAAAHPWDVTDRMVIGRDRVQAGE